MLIFLLTGRWSHHIDAFHIRIKINTMTFRQSHLYVLFFVVSLALPVSAQVAPGPCSAAKTPTLSKNPVAGTKVLSGCATQAGDFIVLTVLPPSKGAPASCLNYYSNLGGQNEPTPLYELPPMLVDPKTHMFSIELTASGKWRALQPQQLICLRELDSQGKQTSVSVGPQEVQLRTYESADSPWGRVRPYLSAGVIFSQNNSQFSSEDLFLGLNLDKNWFAPHHYREFNWLANTYFDAQLTSIPAAACQSSSSGSSTSSNCPASSGVTSGTNNLSNFIASRKAAVIEGGVYLPMFLDSWKWSYQGNDNALFIAPIFEGGYQTITGGTQTVSSPTPGTSTTIATLNSQGLYYFYAGGARLGHYELSSSWNIGPDLLSHLDILFGKWQNFEQCQGECTATSSLVLPTMIALNGRLKIPSTFFQIGFDAITPLTKTAGTQGDLRFFFGVQVDPTCLFRAFQGTQSSLTNCAVGQSSFTGKNMAGH